MDVKIVKQIEILNEKCRAEEIRARNFTKLLKAELKNEKAAGKINGFDIAVELRAFSNDEAFCKSRNIEPGESLFDRYELAYSLLLNDDDFFNSNGNELSTVDGHPLQRLHFGYLMHCLVFHSDLSFQELAKIDNVWIDVLVNCKFQF